MAFVRAHAAPAAVRAPGEPRGVHAARLLRSDTQSVLSLSVLILLFIAASFLILQAGRGTTFYYDEWDFIQGSRLGGVDVLLAPHNGHLELVPITIYLGLFKVVGLGQYTPYRVVMLLLHLVTCFLFFVTVRQRVGRIPALLMVCLILFIGSSWQNILWPFQMSFLLSLSAGLLAFLLIERGGRLAFGAAALAVLISLGSSGLGIPVVAATTVRILADPKRWRMIWIVVPASVCYGYWYLIYGVPQAKESNLPHAALYMLRAAAGAIGGVTGVGTDWGMPLVAVAVALVSLRLARTTLSPWMAGFLTLAGSFWALTAVARADLGDADANRYIYPGALFCLLIASEGLRTVPLRPSFLVMSSVLAAGAVALNAVALIGGAEQLRSNSTRVRAELAAVEIARPTVARDFAPDTLLMPQVTAGPYLDAVSALGSPANSPFEVEQSSESTKIAVDDVLQRAERLGLKATDSLDALGPLPSVDDQDVHATSRGSCVRVTPTSGGVSLTPPPGGLTITSDDGSPVHVQLRRFAGSYGVPAVPNLSSGAHYVLHLGFDQLTHVPWHVKVLATGPLSVCGLPESR